jgi:general secretion pathway protein D
MKTKLLFAVGMMFSAVAGFGQAGGVPRAKNTNPSAPYENSQVKAWIKVDIDKSTDTVHFIRDNNDPYVITKAYRLKHADAYELRPYIRKAVQSKRVDGDDTRVECIKFNNGANLMLVSAEEFRFKKNTNGMSIDEMIKRLDQPNITSSSGQKTYFYFPSYRNAKQLTDMVRNVGGNIKNGAYELTSGKDTIFYDPHLNCVFMYTPAYSKKNIEYMLKQYDVPNPEIALKYTIYEVDAENDGKLGLDFQAWKNNDGVDLLSTGGRYRSNWASSLDGGMINNGSNKTQFLNVNPKWNTKYFDFLTAKGYAKAITTGKLIVRNQKTGLIERKTSMFNFEYEKIPDEQLGETYMALFDKGLVTSGASASSSTVGAYMFKAYDTHGVQITIAGGGISATSPVKAGFTVMKLNVGNSNEIRYYLKLSNTNMYFVKNGANRGQEIDAGGFALYKGVDSTNNTAYNSGTDTWSTLKSYSWEEQTSWNTDNDMVIYKGYKTFTTPSSYGFSIRVTPSVCQKNTTLAITMLNDSLLGFNSDGSPRISKNNTVQTEIMISNKSNRFVVGGLEKKMRVSGVSGIPFLKDIPFLGWIFSTETESTKRTQLVLVAECEITLPDTKIEDGIHGDIMKIDKNLKKAGKNNKWGFEQLILDKDAVKNWIP